MSATTPWDAQAARALIDARREEPGAMLPILHDLQEQFGYVDDEAIPMIAEALNVSKAETLGVISFYHDFRRAPVEGTLVKLCRAESCQAAGGERLVEHLRRRHGIEVDGHGGPGPIIETVYCLGHCALSPAALVDGAPVARLDEAKIDAIVASARGLAR